MLQWQEYVVRFFDFIHFFGVVGDVFTLFITEVGVHVFIAHDFDGVFHANTAMVGGYDHFAGSIGKPLQGFPKRGVLEPGGHHVSIGSFVFGQFPYDVNIGTGVREGIYEVVNHHIEFVFHHVGDLVYEVFSAFEVCDFGIGKLDISAQTLEQIF